MCNLYNQKRMRTEVADLARALFDYGANEPARPSIYPDYAAAVVVNGVEGRELRNLRWGMPSSKKALFEAASKRADKLRAKGEAIDDARFAEILKLEPDKGTTNIRILARFAGRSPTSIARFRICLQHSFPRDAALMLSLTYGSRVRLSG